MKKLFWGVAVVCVVLAAIAALQAQGPAPKTLNDPAILPASLAKHYPPASPMPAYLIEMHLMSQPLSGIMCDLMEQDFENVQKNFEAFRLQYQEVSAMVPEWADRFPLAPVDELGAALGSGDEQKVMAAMQKVGKVCGDCHHTYMPAAYYAYHWGDFDVIKVTDPLSKADVGFADIMMMMESNMTGIGNDLKQGQIENARKQIEGFEARFGAMSQACVACHDTERKYYVDAEITGMIGKLKEVLASEQVDPNLTREMLQKIGQQSCAKCHLVHIPAAYAKAMTTGTM